MSTWSSPSRARLASQACSIQRRDKPAVVLERRVDRVRHLGGDDPVVAVAGDGRAGDALGRAAFVLIGGIDEVHAVIARVRDDVARFGFRRRPAEHHRPEAHGRDVETAAPEAPVLHGSSAVGRGGHDWSSRAWTGDDHSVGAGRCLPRFATLDRSRAAYYRAGFAYRLTQHRFKKRGLAHERSPGRKARRRCVGLVGHVDHRHPSGQDRDPRLPDRAADRPRALPRDDLADAARRAAHAPARPSCSRRRSCRASITARTRRRSRSRAWR